MKMRTRNVKPVALSVLSCAVACLIQAPQAGASILRGEEVTVGPADPKEAWTLYDSSVLTLNGARAGLVLAEKATVHLISGSQADNIHAHTGSVVTVADSNVHDMDRFHTHGAFIVQEGSTARIERSDIYSRGDAALEILSDPFRGDAAGSHVTVADSRLWGYGGGALVGSGSSLSASNTIIQALSTTGFASGAGIVMSGGVFRALDGTIVEGVRDGIRGYAAGDFADDDSTNGVIEISNSQVKGLGGSAISISPNAASAMDGWRIHVHDGGQLEGSDGYLLHVEGRGEFTTKAELFVEETTLNGNVGKYGQANGSIANVDLYNGGRINGRFVDVNDVLIEDTGYWQLTGHSNVATLDLRSGGTVQLGQGEAFNVLDVSGDFVGGGTLLFNTVLGEDDSPTDVLNIGGGTSGSTGVLVNNVGGVGAESENGIEIITVAGASNGDFSLLGRAVAGTYEYFLAKGEDNGNWYLTTAMPVAPPVDPDPCATSPGGAGCPVIDPPIEPEIPVDPPVEPEIPVDPPVDPEIPVDPPVDPEIPVDPPVEPEIPVDPPVDPEIPVDPVEPPAPKVYRPEIGAYLANQAAATDLFTLSLHERLGSADLARGLTDSDDRGATWVRASSDTARFTAAEGQLAVSSDQSLLQAGIDLGRWGDESRGVVGMMLATGRASSNTTSAVTGYRAKGSVTGQAVGFYASWLQRLDASDGAYLDGWVQAARFKNEVKGDALADEQYDSKALSASVEAGYAFKVAEGRGSALFIEPQAQATYVDYSMDGQVHVEANGTSVRTVDAGGLQTRLGVRVHGYRAGRNAARIKPFMALNWVHTGAASNAVSFNRASVTGGRPGATYELKAGAQLQLTGAWSAWGELSTLQGQGGYSNRGAQLGVKYAW